ncbi:MAG: GFA family protein [Myxococcaceae bacterium]|nr:GFA family protein [Myxococcaceae bacterium]
MTTTSNNVHHGSCHCGAVRYRVEIDLSKPVIQCNCSICSRSGTLLAFVPESAFVLEKGEDNLTDYQFGKKVIHHLFCKTCGVRSFARGSGPNGPTVAINTRCLEDVDTTRLKVMHFDGKSR